MAAFIWTAAIQYRFQQQRNLISTSDQTSFRGPSGSSSHKIARFLAVPGFLRHATTSIWNCGWLGWSVVTPGRQIGTEYQPSMAHRNGIHSWLMAIVAGKYVTIANQCSTGSHLARNLSMEWKLFPSLPLKTREYYLWLLQGAFLTRSQTLPMGTTQETAAHHSECDILWTLDSTAILPCFSPTPYMKFIHTRVAGFGEVY